MRATSEVGRKEARPRGTDGARATEESPPPGDRVPPSPPRAKTLTGGGGGGEGGRSEGVAWGGREGAGRVRG